MACPPPPPPPSFPTAGRSDERQRHPMPHARHGAGVGQAQAQHLRHAILHHAKFEGVGINRHPAADPQTACCRPIIYSCMVMCRAPTDGGVARGMQQATSPGWAASHASPHATHCGLCVAASISCARCAACSRRARHPRSTSRARQLNSAPTCSTAQRMTACMKHTPAYQDRWPAWAVISHAQGAPCPACLLATLLTGKWSLTVRFPRQYACWPSMASTALGPACPLAASSACSCGSAATVAASRHSTRSHHAGVRRFFAALAGPSPASPPSAGSSSPM